MQFSVLASLVLVGICAADAFQFITPSAPLGVTGIGGFSRSAFQPTCPSAPRSRASVQLSMAEHGRRDFLKLSSAGFAFLGAQSADAAKAKASDGKWAKHFGEFEEGELDGFTETASGLKYKDVEVGSGAQPKSGQTVICHYSGYLLESGNQFDSSYDRRSPLSFKVGVGQVIKGWDEALLDMKVGGRRVLNIPSKLGYGSKAVGGGVIPANSDLLFYVELLGIGA